MNVLHRQFGLSDVKFAGADAGEMTFTGYGAVFGNVDYYGDVIEPGAFADTLAATQSGGDWPSMLLQHGGWGMSPDDLSPIGVWTELVEDGIGLKVGGKLAETERGKEAYTLLKMTPRPAIDGLSIGYLPKEWEPRSKPDEPRRKLKKVDLIEVSLVTFPANPKARVSDVKSLIDSMGFADVEAHLREAGGFTRAESKYVVTRLRHLCQREAGDDGLIELAASITHNLHTLRN